MKKPADHYLGAIAFASLNAFALAGMGLFTKLLTGYFGPVETVFFRNFSSLILILMFLAATRKFSVLGTARPWAHLLRGAIGTAGIILGAWSLSLLKLSEATVLLFTSPLFTVLLSVPFLGERPGLFRILAVITGFSGVAIMAWPIGSMPLLGLIAGLSWGFASGCVDVCLRWLGSTENSYTTVFYFVLFGTLTTGLYWPFASRGMLELDQAIVLIILGLGATGVTSLLAKTQSYRLGEASVVAPFMYTMLVWSVVFDYFVWDKVITLNVLAGAVIIIASNLVILWREGKKGACPHHVTEE